MSIFKAIKNRIVSVFIDAITIPAAEYAALKEVDHINRERVAA